MNYTIETIADFCKGQAYISFSGSMVQNVIIDHRDLNWHGALFVALKGSKVDGHSFIPEMLKQGVIHFLVTDKSSIDQHEGTANFILVENAIQALQDIAAEHRENFNTPIIGITGSNGKTIVKEWLNELLEPSFSICRSPKSYNSQIGVALSVTKLNRNHTLAIFEAGISRPSEMQSLQRMIAPTLGVFTNLGDAHAAHFDSGNQKLTEKLSLFHDTKQVVCCMDQPWYKHMDGSEQSKFFTWSKLDPKANLFVKEEKTFALSTYLTLEHKSNTYSIVAPFTDKASIENVLQCFCICVLLGKADFETIKRFENLSPVAMRMEVKQGIENSILIDDTYNSDLGSLQAALDQLRNQKSKTRLVILSDMSENQSSMGLYADINRLMIDNKVDELVAIGPELAKNKAVFDIKNVEFFANTHDYWTQLDPKSLREKAILIKGARRFQMEDLVKKLQAQKHETVLQVNLQDLSDNLQFYRSKIKSAKIMVMVKAFGYGSGGYEVAQFLQTQKVDYLAVAYVDEGVELRNKGIRMPILVMSPSALTFESLIKNGLEAELYSIQVLSQFIEAARGLRHYFDEINIHLKIDSGMHRLGFEQKDLNEVFSLLKSAPFLKVASIFTHLSAADDPSEIDFSNQQISVFQSMADQLDASLGYKPMRHALNSSGVLRYPNYQFDMVRLGIGLYGFVGTDHNKYLKALGIFKSYIIQIRTVSASESVGYSRGGKHSAERRIATVGVGYADGLDRRLGNGKWSLKWQGQNCAIVGNVCMDMVMIDVTSCSAREGDEVLIFEGSDDIQKMAEFLETIPYEILTKVSQRVRRVYLQE